MCPDTPAAQFLVFAPLFPPTAADPDYPVQVAGVARALKSAAIGSAHRQFRNEGTGFRAKLTVEFPSLIMPSVVTRHRWHLACEFSNRIRAAISEPPPA